MKLDPNNAQDREFLRKHKNPATGRTLLEDQVEYEKQVADKIIVSAGKSGSEATAQQRGLNGLNNLDIPNPVGANFSVTLPLPVERKMNGLEGGYYDYLSLRLRAGEILDFKFEPFNLRLASPKCWYRVDFMVVNLDRQLELHETKGEKVWDDALVKFKVAAETFPYFIFKWVVKVDGGGYEIKSLRGGRWQKCEV